MVSIKTPKEIEIMRQGGEILASVLNALAKETKPGVTTEWLNELAEDLILEKGALPAFKGYQGFPSALCVSINEQIVHGLPSERKIEEGDVVGLDLGVLFPPEHCGGCPFSGGCAGEPGLYTDAAISIGAGKISAESKKLIEATKGALDAAIDLVKPGRKLSEISAAIQKYAQDRGFNVIRELVGHGVGKEIHEDPEIPNFSEGWQGEEIILKEGMTLAIEPMLSAGGYQIKKGKDKSSYETKDGSITAHFERTVVVTKNGCEILTKI
jgi:methionyl aminopeptidase